jgi:hypothetical protein
MDPHPLPSDVEDRLMRALEKKIAAGKGEPIT